MVPLGYSPISQLNKAGNSSVIHSIHLSPPIQVENQARHSSEAPKCAGSAGRAIFSRPIQLLFDPPISPTQRISHKASLVARSQSSQIV
ncbi:hypothetical protein AVEN_263712-1 [Araneus ventricosus]|uniref:Uncharacterized protein n=1 Tax=Araneus ventricosus TaxID=182803 RepID=A0A4Y2ASF5_ARAVE|nr:hypothetical protein AVEN_263712-1 [Araneus ventricosus]